MITRINIAQESYGGLDGWYVRVYCQIDDDILAETITEWGPFDTAEAAIRSAAAYVLAPPSLGTQCPA